jgi:hypothetical protein
MNKYLIIGLVIVICALISGCVSATSTETTITHLQIIWTEYFNSQSITKIYISEDNVTCYVFNRNNGGGISCLKNI